MPKRLSLSLIVLYAAVHGCRPPTPQAARPELCPESWIRTALPSPGVSLCRPDFFKFFGDVTFARWLDTMPLFRQRARLDAWSDSSSSPPTMQREMASLDSMEHPNAPRRTLCIDCPRYTDIHTDSVRLDERWILREHADQCCSFADMGTVSATRLVLQVGRHEWLVIAFVAPTAPSDSLFARMIATLRLPPQEVP